MIKALIGYGVSAVLLFFAVLFALASVYAPMRIVVSVIFFFAGFFLLYIVWKRQPTKVVQKVEVPGKIEVHEIKCPNCSASLDIRRIQVINGIPTIKCPYCGHISEITEEPKW